MYVKDGGEYTSELCEGFLPSSVTHIVTLIECRGLWRRLTDNSTWCLFAEVEFEYSNEDITTETYYSITQICILKEICMCVSKM